MKAIALTYHDAVKDNFNESGFRGSGGNRYKLTVSNMERHFKEIDALITDNPSNIYSFLDKPEQAHAPLFLTFDDGGVSAATYIVPLLDQFGWMGHFFITGGCVDTPLFLNSKQIREIHEKGHVIGSHSWSHPKQMSKCSWKELESEWTMSIMKLSDIIGAQVNTASVPGGYFSQDVAKAASACGIKALFTSEPVKKSYYVDNCLVLGRYALLSDTPLNVVGALTSGHNSFHQLKQYLFWNTKKVVKLIGGKHYLTIRRRIVRANENI